MKVPVDECPAGAVMDAAVARVLGYECTCDEDGAPFDCPIHCDDVPHTKSRYSTDIAAAWEPWLQLTEEEPHSWAMYSSKDGCVQIEHHPENWAREFGAGDVMAYGLAPLAICRAFLKARGIEFVEVPWKGVHYSVGEAVEVT